MATLVDTQVFEAQLVLSEDKDNGRLVARGPFGRADIPTANGRIYRTKLWERELGKLSEKVKNRRCLGMLDHPKDGKTALSGGSHLITGAVLESDGTIMGAAEILPTPAGKILETLIRSGVKVGISSRGVGTTTPKGNGKQEVNDDYNLMTWDFVADPANATSYPEFHAEDVQLEQPQMEEIMTTEKMTEETLRELYPDLVEGIMEDAIGAAIQELSTEDENEAAHEAALSQMQDRLMGMVREERSGIEEEVRSDLMSDPSLGGPRLVVENLVEMLRPYMLDEDVDAVVSNYEEALVEAQEDIETLAGDNAEKDVIIDQLLQVSEDLGRRYYMAETLMLIEDAQVAGRIVSLVGNPGNYDDNDDFKGALRAAIASVRDDASYHEDAGDEIDALEEENAALKQALSESVGIGEMLSVRAYAEKRIANHPLSPAIRGLMEEHSPTSQEDVEAMVEAVEKNYEPSDEYGAVAASLGGGLSHLTEGDEDVSTVLDEDLGGEDSSMFLGMSRRELQQRAGIIGEDDNGNGNNFPY
jgi:hypothetical protein